MEKDKWNAWHGCHKYSEGCRNCYMFHLDAKRGRPEWSDTVFKTGKFDYPLKKDRHGNYKIPAGQRLSVNMTSDTFIEEAERWLPEFWDIIRQRPDLIFWLLTKRVHRIAQSLPGDWRNGYDNVCLNISVEDQNAFDARWPVFSQIPAKHKTLCMAPLIGPVDIHPALESGQLEFVEVGGENYADPRPCHVEWVEEIAKACNACRVNFAWYESGTKLSYKGKIKEWPDKSDQSKIAYFAGLNKIHKKPDYILRDPKDGHILTKDERYKPAYNLENCLFCSNRIMCNGCLSCGECGRKETGTLEQIWEKEDWLIKHYPPKTYKAYMSRKEE